jgi:hypothetical protein
MKYSAKIINDIINCFNKNDVEISSKNIKNIHKAIEEVIELSNVTLLNENQNSLFSFKSLEFDISKKELIVTKLWYNYGLFQIFANEKIINHIANIETELLDFKIELFSISNSYALAYTKNNKFIDFFSYPLSTGNLLGIEEDSFVQFLAKLNLPLFLNEIKNINNSKLSIFLIDVDYKNSLTTISFFLSLRNLLNVNYHSFLENFENIDKVIDFINYDFLENDVGVLGFDIKNKTFYIEIFPVDLQQFLQTITKYFEIDEAYLKSLDAPEYGNYSFKFSWNKQKQISFSITKIYKNPIHKQF